MRRPPERALFRRPSSVAAFGATFSCRRAEVLGCLKACNRTYERSRLTAEPLRFLERVHARDLAARTRRRRKEGRTPGRACRTQPPTPDWGGRAGRCEGRRAIIGVHRGFCRTSGARGKANSRDQAVSLLNEDSALACRFCRSDYALGLLWCAVSPYAITPARREDRVTGGGPVAPRPLCGVGTLPRCSGPLPGPHRQGAWRYACHGPCGPVSSRLAWSLFRTCA
ncbi:DUF6233 domain-containing protein [Streptomyces sp. NBC_00057]|uniref:DUF6233 domain-containing protein n=1 Tax=Streptomyces sp. NBC_00057 TaxID=2975634 RepID=UPI00386ECB76